MEKFTDMKEGRLATSRIFFINGTDARKLREVTCAE